MENQEYAELCFVCEVVEDYDVQYKRALWHQIQYAILIQKVPIWGTG